MDIGGGSTEFILARGNREIGLWSMDLGVVHLTETFIKSDPPAASEIARMEKEIQGVITALKERMKKTELTLQSALRKPESNSSAQRARSRPSRP